METPAGMVYCTTNHGDPRGFRCPSELAANRQNHIVIATREELFKL